MLVLGIAAGGMTTRFWTSRDQRERVEVRKRRWSGRPSGLHTCSLPVAKFDDRSRKTDESHVSGEDRILRMHVCMHVCMHHRALCENMGQRQQTADRQTPGRARGRFPGRCQQKRNTTETGTDHRGKQIRCNERMSTKKMSKLPATRRTLPQHGGQDESERARTSQSGNLAMWQGMELDSIDCIDCIDCMGAC